MSFIDPNDFKSVSLEISLMNTHTRVEIRKKDRIHLIEMLERGMILEVPRRTCQKGHYLVLTIDATDPTGPEDKHTLFKTGAKVEELESLQGTGDSPGSDRITVSLLQHDREAWEVFNRLFSARQDEIGKFFAAVRGYD